MSYFRYFPLVNYTFGDEKLPDAFQNIAVYSDVVDEVKNNIAFYQDYFIPEGERPDQTSYFLYETSTLHWTFFLMNDKLREKGWPLSNYDLVEKAKKDYSFTTLTTRTKLTDKFKVGQVITGTSSGTTATINHRHLDLGQIVIHRSSGSFIPGETITSTSSEGVFEQITLLSSSLEYLAAHHYENVSGEVVDIDPEVGPGAQLVEVTYLDRLFEQNESLKQIKIIKPSALSTVVSTFREAIST